MTENVTPCLFCGQRHTLSDMELTFGLPDAVFGVPESEREQRVKASEDACIIDERLFFVRCVLGLPLVDQPDDQYHFGVWAQVGEADFVTLVRHWDDPMQDALPPFTAYLANHIPFCGDTVGLMADLQTTGSTTRPTLTVHDTQAVIGQLQQGGIYTNDAMRFLHFDQDLPEDL